MTTTLFLSKMSTRFLTATAKTLSLSRPAAFSLSAKTTLTRALSHHRSFSLSTATAKTLNLSHRSDISPPQVNELLDEFNEHYGTSMPEDLRKLYDMHREELFQEEAYSLDDLKSLHCFYQFVVIKRSEADQFGERVDELLGWFDKETTKANEIITLKLRKDIHEMIMKANKYSMRAKKDGNPDLVEELEQMYWTLIDTREKAIRAKAAEPNDDNNKTRYLERKSVSDWQADNFIVEVNELLDWFEKETMEATHKTQKLRKEYETIYLNLLALERAEDDDEEGDHTWYSYLKKLEMFFLNLRKKKAKAILAKLKANELAKEQAKAAKLLYPFLLHSLSSSSIIAPRTYYCGAGGGLKSDCSVVELLYWFEKEATEANDTIQTIRKVYETIFAKLVAEERPVLVEDVEELYDFNWEIAVKFRQMLDLEDSNGTRSHVRSVEEARERRRRKTEVTGSKWILHLEKFGWHPYWFESRLMKVKEMIQKLRKDHEMIAQKLQLANDEEKAVLVEELKEMFSSLSEKQAKAIHAKAMAAKALDHKAKATELLSCFYVF